MRYVRCTDFPGTLLAHIGHIWVAIVVIGVLFNLPGMARRVNTLYQVQYRTPSEKWDKARSRVGFTGDRTFGSRDRVVVVERTYQRTRNTARVSSQYSY